MESTRRGVQDIRAPCCRPQASAKWALARRRTPSRASESSRSRADSTIQRQVLAAPVHVDGTQRRMLRFPPTMRIRQHVNPLELHFETFRGEAPRSMPRASRGRDRLRRRAVPVRARARRIRRAQYVGLEIREDLVELRQQARRSETGAAGARGVLPRAAAHGRDLSARQRRRASTSTSPIRGSSAATTMRRMVDAALAEQHR